MKGVRRDPVAEYSMVVNYHRGVELRDLRGSAPAEVHRRLCIQQQLLRRLWWHGCGRRNHHCGRWSPQQVSGAFIYDPVFNGILIVGLIAGGLYLFFREGGHGTPVDGLHNGFIAPLLVYLVVISSLVIFQSGFEHWLWWAIAAAALAIWVWSFKKDVGEERLDQRVYRAKHGVSAIPGLEWLIDAINGGDTCELWPGRT